MNAELQTAAILLAGSFAATWLLVALLVRFAPQIGLLDKPNERSLHQNVTPRGGGLGFVMVVAAMAGWLLIADGIGPGFRVHEMLRMPLTVYLCASVFIAMVSLRDDFQSLSSGLRLLCQIGAAVAAVISMGGFQMFTMPTGGVIELGLAGQVVTVVWIIGLTNVYNFMDGVNGIAGVQGVIAALAWTLAGMWIDAPVVTMIGAVMAGGCAGFLVHNWTPAKIFMGDVGSAFLGYSFAVLPLLALKETTGEGSRVLHGVAPVFSTLVVWPFVGDGFLTFVRRARQGETVWKPHRSHLYQRLVQSGWSHAQVSSLYACWCLCSAPVAAGWGMSGGSWWALAGVGAFALVSLGVMFAFVTQREERRRLRHA